jgi:S1-C subfamily serine protease
MMQMTGRPTILLAMTTIAGLMLGFGPTALRADDHDNDVDVKVIQRHEGKIRIVAEDEDGNRHERTIEYDGDEPRAFLGVRTEEAEGGGALVEDVVEDSPAERVGLREGDLIVGLDGAPIDDSWDLMEQVLAQRPGDLVDLELLRDGRHEGLSVELGEREPEFDFDFDFSGLEGLEGLGEKLEQLGEQLEGLDVHVDFSDLDLPDLSFLGHHGARRPKLGVHLVQPTAELRQHFGAPADAGVIVGKVLADMPAEMAGIRVGDVIVSADGREIEDASDLIDVLEDVDSETIELELIRDGVALRLDVFIAAEEPEDESAFDPGE